MIKKRIIFNVIATISTSIFLSNVFILSKVSAAAYSKSERIYGKNRYETAVKISQKGWERGANCAILASGEGYADALCAAPLAKINDAPILLVQKNKLDLNVLRELKRLGVKNVYIIGGQGSISKEVEDKIKSETNSKIERIEGKNRYETSIKIAEKLEKSKKNTGTVNENKKSKELILASGENYADALSAAPIGAIREIPIVLTKSNELPKETKEYIEKVNANKTYIIGGQASISDSIENSILGSKRIYGKDRFETNVAVAKAFPSDFDFKSSYVALGVGPTGGEFADALAASAIAAKNSAPVILTSKELTDVTKTLSQENFLPSSKITVLGGTNNIPEETVQNMRAVAELMNEEEGLYDRDVKESAVITAKDVTVNHITINGNLYIEESDAEIFKVKVNGTIFINPGENGECKLEDVEAEKIVILSGTDRGIFFKDVRADKLEVRNKNKTRVVLEELTKFKKTEVLTATILQNMLGSFGEVSIKDTLKDKDIELHGAFHEKIILEGSVNLNAFPANYIEKIEIRTGKNDEILLDGNCREVEVYSGANIKVTKNTKGDIIAKTLEAENCAKIDMPQNLNIKVKNFKLYNITGEGREQFIN
ncbi:cell wall-binding repeat-containing protein [Clostridium cochlearium]|uniref:cell wall-binding repeat-containing protein n=1 Tax=Clostridium cochlearium TaxID=1494 RepID=UPI0017A8AB3B|nr:cell wall-binding repeat-containing protein [Clostridium cochlearium]NMA58813.1 cell wall-binding repeat-containing protein [Clostridium cochlearium]